jgi:hypothetical protein
MVFDPNTFGYLPGKAPPPSLVSVARPRAPIRSGRSGGTGHRHPVLPDQPSQGNDLYQQLASMLSGPAPSIDTSLLEQQASSQVNAKYDPQIAELQRMMGQSTTRANTSKAEIGKMFAALASADMGDIAGINKSYGNAEASTKTSYDQLKSQIADEYTNARKQQMDEFKRLNIQAAAPDAFAGQAKDQEYFSNQTALQGQSALAALTEMQQAGVQNSRANSEAARFEGSTRQADITSQLNDLLQQYGGKIGDLRAAKSSDLSGALAQLQQQAVQAQQQAQQQNFQNLLSLGNLKVGQDRLALDTAKANQPHTAQLKGLQGAASYIANQLPSNKGEANDLMTILNGGISNPSPKDIQLPNSTQARYLNPEEMAARVKNEAARRGYGPLEQQIIFNAALTYYGKF